jgi:hypothetical protein
MNLDWRWGETGSGLYLDTMTPLNIANLLRVADDYHNKDSAVSNNFQDGADLDDIGGGVEVWVLENNGMCEIQNYYNLQIVKVSINVLQPNL